MNAIIPVREGLTPRQLTAFRFIQTHIATHGTAPTYMQIALALGVKSKGVVKHLVDALRDKGWITFRPHINNSIAILPAPAFAVQRPRWLLPPDVEAKLLRHCCATNEDPADVISDAVALFLDEAEGSVAA